MVLATTSLAPAPVRARANAAASRRSRDIATHATSNARKLVEWTSADDVVPSQTLPSSSSSRPSRRAACASVLGLLSSVTFSRDGSRSLVARADDEDDELAAAEATMRDVMSRNSGEQTFARRESLRNIDGLDACAFEVSSLWTLGEGESKGDETIWGTFVDPVNGEAVQKALVFATRDFGVKSIADLGKPEDVQVAKALGLDKLDDSYRRADLLGAAKRVDKVTGQIYYDWELVASPPPKSCPSAVGCLYPEHIYLISASVLNGVLYVLSMDATPAQWRVTGNSVKRIRNSFAVGVKQEEVTVKEEAVGVEERTS